MKKYWLFILIVLQPILDIIAFWTASESGTVSGIIRLCILVAVFCYLSIKHYKNKTFIVITLVLLTVFGLHILNCFRLGYISLFRDLNYMARVAFMPVLAMLFCFEINDENIEKQILSGLLVNIVLVVLVIIVSYFTKTYTYTYGEGLGISGWVTMDNRCCHSDILSTLCIFLVYFSIKYENIVFKFLFPIAVFILLITNGTRACYVTLFGITIGISVFLILRPRFTGKQLELKYKYTVCILLLLAVAAYIIYPYTPRAKEEEYKRLHFSVVEKEFCAKMSKLGYDNIYDMTLEEKMSDPVFHEELKIYYNAFCWGGIPQIVERFDLDTIIYKYGGTIDSGILGNTRTMKQKYASLIMDTQDTLTHFTGFEIAQLGDDMIVDMENDYYAILYYYGYLGLAAYILAAAYMYYRIILKLTENFKMSLTDFNFILLLAFSIQLGLAFFSGAMFRRPNASIYFSIVTGLLYYETKHNYSGV